MHDFWQTILDILQQIGPASLFDILIIAAIIYWVLLLFRGTTAMSLLRGIALVSVGVLLVSRVLNLAAVNWLVSNAVTGLIIAIPIIFQPEIRRALERVGRTGVWALGGRSPYEEVIDTVITASLRLAQKRHGALLVLERDTGLEEYIDTGITMDAAPSVELLEGLFYPKSPLHDGAVILRGDRIIAAACTLPLSQNSLPTSLGLRHRAAVGVTEHSDAVSVVVSEETGDISVAANGRLLRQLDDSQLRAVLSGLLRPSAVAPARARWTATRPR